jgi:hypothetical protein
MNPVPQELVVNFDVMVSSSKPTLEPRLLEAIDYPTDRAALLCRAKKIDAPEAVQEAIRRLPSGSFRSLDELVTAVENISAV